MADNTFAKGLEIRTDVLGAEYVKKALADADSFTRPFQDLVTEYAVYAGVPAGVDSFRVARETFAELDED